MLKIGHRGTAALAPENTAAGFKKAIDMNLDMVELDVQLTKDEEVVVIHDYDLQRVAGVDAKIADLTLDQLKEIDVASYFAADYAEQRVMTLTEVIELVRNELMLNIELKMIAEKEQILIDKVKKILRQENFIGQVIISSFNHCYVKEFGPEFKTAVLINSHPVDVVAMIESANADGVHPNHKLLTAELIEQVQQAGCFVNTWTVNDENKITELKSWGVDGIVTDYPEIISI
ncbi:glycerophosphodiester phosphodiesterase [Halanaerobacter jeridensis]|uniref:Glycerophosphoryl diester phosphodiesterase n=1 Tax=Halanaerobacter jeridensis TaxID=706427 RepID=A0A939BNL7_9FIRM|nr:glycerophosphodiester phosphodiesterase family protein [Halanaerobacter jeridensis]MBM7555458.1 glycerophosphoryl diester phosphodiesterase [Halanaerobacter jeridensis]